MKRNALLVATMLLLSSSPVMGAAIIIKPTTPVSWMPNGEVFDPLRGQGIGYQTTTYQTPVSPDIRLYSPVQTFTGHNIKSTVLGNAIGLVHDGVTYMNQSGEFQLNSMRHYPPGSTVSESDLPISSLAWFGWGRPGQAISRTYLVIDHELNTIVERTLPTEITIGFTSINTVTLRSNSGWADMRWIAQAGGGYWEVTRWGYETTPNTPARVPPLSGCPSDLNADHDTNVSDLSIMLAQFGTSVTPGTGADTNGDGVVNTADLSEMLSWFGCNQIELP